MIHVGGPICRVGDTVRQRCAWCGEQLLEGEDAFGLVGDGSVGKLIRRSDCCGQRQVLGFVGDDRPWWIPGDRMLLEESCLHGDGLPRDAIVAGRYATPDR